MTTSRRKERNHLVRALGAALISCLVFFACGRESRPPNVLVIGVDTLRPDHLGCYGYERRTSPNIDRLADEGVLFENTVSQCPWTLPSFATAFTSLYPSQHGAGTLRHKMRTTFPTLATILSDAGYNTGAVISSPVLDSGTGIARGFQYYDVRQEEPVRTADEVTACALGWIDGGDTRPFFMFVHYWDPHDPYGPPHPYDTVFDPSYHGGMGNIVNLRALGFTSATQVGATLDEESGRISDRDLEHAIALYDGEIAFADNSIGDLLSGLEERSIKDNTLIVLMADHGEEFLEHDGVGHGHTVFNEVIRVPLIFTFPEVIPAGRRITEQTRLLDVTPTIIDLLGLASDFGFEGASLLPLLTGRGKVSGREKALFPAAVAYSEGVREGPEKKAVTAYPWKLIYELSSTDEMFFDLRGDPGETENRIADHGETASPFEELLSRALFEMSDDWYVEVAGGDSPHTFDIAISVETGTRNGWVYPFKTLENGNRVVTSGREALRGAPGSAFEITDLRSEEPVTMGFKIHPSRGMGTKFNFEMDGKAAGTRTFIGGSLSHPDQMPFSVPKRRARTELASGPPERPEPPYILVWLVEGRYGGEIPADLSEKVKKELRALGYIQ